MNKGQQVLRSNEAVCFPRCEEEGDAWKYVVNKYVLHVTRSFVLYPIVALFGVLITFWCRGSGGIYQSRGLSALFNS